MINTKGLTKDALKKKFEIKFKKAEMWPILMKRVLT